MAKAPSSNSKTIQAIPKKSAQGRSKRTNLAATPNRAKLRRYRGQGK